MTGANGSQRPDFAAIAQCISRDAHVLDLGCGDGTLLCIHLSSQPQFWDGFIEVFELHEFAKDPRVATRMLRIENYDLIAEVTGKIIATKPRAHWMALLEKADVPFAPTAVEISSTDTRPLSASASPRASGRRRWTPSGRGSPTRSWRARRWWRPPTNCTALTARGAKSRATRRDPRPASGWTW